MTTTVSRRQALLAAAGAAALASMPRAFAADTAALQPVLDWLNRIGQDNYGKPWTLDDLAALQYLDFEDEPQKKCTDEDFALLALLPELGGIDLGLYQAAVPGDAACVHLAKIPKLWTITLTFCPIGDPGIAAFEGHPTLASMGLDSTKVTGAAGASFAKMPVLDDLNLTSTGMDDAGLEALSASQTITSVSVAGCAGVTDAGLASLAKLPLLKRVSLNNCKIDEGLKAFGGSTTIVELGFMSAGVTDKGIAGLAGMTAIESLYLWSNPGITDEGFKTVGTLKTLATIYGNGASVTDAGIAHLKDLQALAWLWLDDCKALTDACVPHLVKLQALEMVTLSNTKLTDKGLLALAALPKLSSVSCAGTAVTQAGVDAFKKKKPEADVSI